MLVYRSTVAAAIFAGALLVGCTAPDQPTDLRTDGPPNVTTVMVMSDLRTDVDPSPPDLSRLLEEATYCRKNDEKRPGLVGLPDVTTTQVCPDDLTKTVDTEGATEGAPPNWFARVVFDELLDPTVEDLLPVLDGMGKPTGVMYGTLKDTQPVTLKCTPVGGQAVDVQYNGYYVPNGNSISWPLGPALFITPVDTMGVPTGTKVPTGATCAIAIKDMVHNKDGQSVPADQRSYSFKIASMKLRFSAPDPGDGDNGAIELRPKSPVQFYWTAAFSTMPDPAEIKIFSAPNLNVSAANTDGDPDPTVCGTGGAAVAAADIVTAVGAPDPDADEATTAITTALIMDLTLASPAPLKWAPTTTYRIEFGANAKITPAQGGPDGTFPANYKLCFHTTAM